MLVFHRLHCSQYSWRLKHREGFERLVHTLQSFPSRPTTLPARRSLPVAQAESKRRKESVVSLSCISQFPNHQRTAAVSCLVLPRVCAALAELAMPAVQWLLSCFVLQCTTQEGKQVCSILAVTAMPAARSCCNHCPLSCAAWEGQAEFLQATAAG